MECHGRIFNPNNSRTRNLRNMPNYRNMARTIGRGLYNSARRAYINYRGPTTRAAARYRRAVTNRAYTAAGGATIAAGVAGAKRTYNWARGPSKRLKRGKVMPRNFARRVKAVVNANEPKGVYKKRLFDRRVNGPGSSEEASIYQDVILENKEILDGVAVLFNGKTKSSTYPGTGNFTAKDMDIDLRSYTCRGIYHNLSQHVARVEVYTCRPKVPNTSSPRFCWEQQLLSIGTAVTPHQPIMTIHDGNNNLSKYWSVSKKMVTIKPGESKTLYYVRRPSQTIKVEDLYTNDNLDQYSRKNGCVIMYRNLRPVAANATEIISPNYAQIHGLEKRIEMSYSCPDNAEDIYQRDTLEHYDNLSNNQTGIQPFPSFPGTANLPQPAQ